MKILCKLLHTAAVEGKDPKAELHKYLLQYRATPHPTPGLSPAEMLFQRKIRTKLPQWFNRHESVEMAAVRSRHDAKKLVQKKNFDRRRRAKDKEINVGDQIIVKQEKSTTRPPFDPKPYTVHGVDGNRISASRDDGSRVRDKNYVKKVKHRAEHLKPSWEKDARRSAVVVSDNDNDIEGQWKSAAEERAERERASEERGEESAAEDYGEYSAYDVGDDMAAHLHNLLQAAEDREDDSRRVTRSKGANLHWNPSMGDKDVILRK